MSGDQGSRHWGPGETQFARPRTTSMHPSGSNRLQVRKNVEIKHLRSGALYRSIRPAGCSILVPWLGAGSTRRSLLTGTGTLGRRARPLRESAAKPGRPSMTLNAQCRYFDFRVDRLLTYCGLDASVPS